MADLIDSFIAPVGQQQLDTAEASLQKILSDIQLINRTGITFGNNVRASGNLQDLTANTVRLERELAKLQQSQNAVQISAIRLQQAQERQAASAAKAAQQAQNQSSAYLRLSEQYNKAARAAQDLAVTQGITSQAFQTAAASARALHGQLLAIDQAVGRSQRNVGNYGSALTSVWSGLKTIANIVPGLGISGIFLLAFEAISKFWSVLSKTEKSMGSLKTQQDDLNKAFASSEYAKAVEDVNELRINVDLAKNGFLDKNKVLNQYNETLGKTMGQVKSLDDVEQKLTAHGEDYIKMTLYKAAANIALEEAAKKSYEAEQTRLKTVEDFLTKGDEVNKALSGFSRTESGIAHQRQVMAEVEKKNFDAAAERRAGAIKANEDAAKTQLGIAEKFLRDAAAISKKSGFDFFGGAFADKAKAPPQVAVIESLPALIKPIANEIGSLMDSALAPPKDLSETWRRAFEQVGIAITQQRILDMEKTEKLVGEKREQLEKEIANNLYQIGKTLLDRQFQDQLDQLRERQELVNTTKDNEIAAIEASAESEEKKQQLKMQAEAKAAAQTKQIQEEEKKAKRSAAEADKVAALAQIAINTAIGLTNAYAIPYGAGIPLIPYIIAAGATQAAIVAATPIPEYYTGTDSSVEGFAHVGERGTEMYVTPDGKLGFTPDQDTIAYLQRGTKIINHKETMSIVDNLAKGYLPDRQRDSIFSNHDVIEAADKNTQTLVRELRRNKQDNKRSGWDLYELRKTRKMF